VGCSTGFFGALGSGSLPGSCSRSRVARCAQDQVPGLDRQYAQSDAKVRQDEGEFADLRQADRDDQRGSCFLAEEAQQQEGDAAARRHHREGEGDHARLAEQDGRIEQHADRDKEEHREGIAQWQGFFRRPLAERRSRQDHAGEEGAQCDGDAEQFRCGEGHAQRHRQDRQAEQLTASGVGNIMKHRGDHAPPHQQHQRGKDCQLAESERQCLGHDQGLDIGPLHRGGQGRQHHQGQDGEKILHHQPADGDAAPLAFHQATVLQGPQHDHGAGHRKAEAEYKSRRQRPVE
jgi:hypothetical protein